MKRHRVGIVGLLQESNTFIAGVTTRAHFEADLLLHGEAIREAMAGAPHEVGGFFAGLDEAGIEAVPLFLARALPYGVIKKEDFEGLVAELLCASVRRAGMVGGVFSPCIGVGFPLCVSEHVSCLYLTGINVYHSVSRAKLIHVGKSDTRRYSADTCGYKISTPLSSVSDCKIRRDLGKKGPSSYR